MFALKQLNIFKGRSISNTTKKFTDECLNIEGKCALVTDGTNGVGFAFANELLKNDAANVIITGKDEREGINATCLLQKYYGRHKVNFHKMNVNYKSEFEKTFKYIKEKFIGLDIYINNAETKEEKDIINTNLVSKIQGIILASKYMTNGGVILNHTSALGLDAKPNMIAYSAASAGVITASKAFGDEIYFNKNKIKMIALCSEPQLFTLPEESDQTEHCMRKVLVDCNDEDDKRYYDTVAKSAMYLMKCAARNTIWLCQRNRTLCMIELQKIKDFSVKFELPPKNVD